MELQPAKPILIASRMLPLHAELLALLTGLAPDDWFKPTAAPGWSVKDIAAHLLDTDIRRLSYQRDRLPSPRPPGPLDSYRDLVDYIDALNAEWITAARRISPPVLLEFLSLTGPQVAELFESLDPYAPAGTAVAWAGERESPNWFDIAREYTEKWMHQQHIRQAVARPGLLERQWLGPVLDTFLRGLPYTYREVQAPVGTCVTVSISGEAGGAWSLVKHSLGWALYTGRAEAAAAWVQLDQDTAWRVFTKGLSPAQAQARTQINGDEGLGRRVLDLVAIMA